VLTEVLKLVAEQGWFDTSRAHEKSIFFSQGASLWMVLSRRGHPDTFVKFSDLVSLEAEARRCEDASVQYPDHAPPFLGYARRAPLEVMATRAMTFRPVTSAMTHAARESPAIRAGLQTYFRLMQARAETAVASAPARTWLDDLSRHFGESEVHQHALTVLRHASEQLRALPSMPQHGDLVMNNLGLDTQGQLVIFDWEDFGAIDLPGLDIFTLEYSFAIEAGQRPNRDRWPAPAPAFNGHACCSLLGIDPEFYGRMRLVYALVFRYLKRNYGPEVQVRLDRLIHVLSPH
jgi:hypothetical protein